jgi:hypothetical protein
MCHRNGRLFVDAELLVTDRCKGYRYTVIRKKLLFFPAMRYVNAVNVSFVIRCNNAEGSGASRVTRRSVQNRTLRTRRTLTAADEFGTRVDRIIPFGVKPVVHEMNSVEVGILDLDAFLIGPRIDGAFDFQAGRGGCRADQFDNRQMVCQRAASPRLGNVAEHAVLDLVPLCAAETYAERSNAQDPYGSCLKDDGGPIGVDFQE